MSHSMFFRRLLLSAVLLAPAWSEAGIAEYPEVQLFIAHMAARHGFEAAALDEVFSQVDIQTKVLDAMAKPYEAKPWFEYRKLFLTEARIQNGLYFWERNQTALNRAALRYGVPQEMIAAIIGIETSYGQRSGNYRVIEALSTLAFEYPKRAEFFRGELEAFLLLSREEGINPLIPLGSYAGAMGLPQFMPSSYRRYAADLDGDGRRDVWNNPDDAIASVAHYFSRNGWRSGEAVAFPASVSLESPSGLADNRQLKPHRSILSFKQLGVESQEDLPLTLHAALIELDSGAGPEFWLTLQNFYAITRYNHSPLYAMAAFQLSQALKAKHVEVRVVKDHSANPE